MEFVLLLVCSLLFITPRAAGTAVLDVDGNEVQRGQLYYATSLRRPGGGLTLAALNKSCPLRVARAPFNDWLGRPVAIFPENPNDDTVREGRTFQIMFAEPTRCPESTVWKLDGGTGYVTTGGSTTAAIGPHYSRFALREVGGDSHRPDYQIEVCPCSVGADRPSCRMGCLGSLGLAEEGSNILLSIHSDRPHIVNFAKVNKQGASMIRPALARPN